MSVIPPSSGPITFDYVEAPSRWRKRAGRIVFALVVVALAVCTWRWGPYLWRQSQLLYWQGQCLTFSAPVDQVVYEEEPAAAARLLLGSDFAPHVLNPRPGYKIQPTTVQATVFCPQCWRALWTIVPPPSASLLGVGSGGNRAIIFLHERISPAGHRRLVSVSYAPYPDSFVPGYNYVASATTPATWSGQRTVPRPWFTEFQSTSRTPRHPPLVRVFAGQPDPSDRAHFTIRYQMWGQEDVLDGRLRDDDQITLTPRQPPEWPAN